MAGDIRSKQKKVREMGYKAAREDKLFPRELQNTREDDWEDAKIYGMNTRQGQNHWQRHMKSYGETLKERRRNEIADKLLKKGGK